MSEIELKVIFDDDKSPIVNLLEFNTQIISFLDSIVTFKKTNLLENFLMGNAMQEIGEVEFLKMYVKWMACLNIAIASQESDIVMKMDTVLRGLAKEIIHAHEKKEQNKK